MSAQFLINQINDLEAIITAYNAAILALGSGNHQSYELDTGQSRQRVTRLDLEKLQKVRRDLLNEYQELCALAGVGRSVVTVQPRF